MMLRLKSYNCRGLRKAELANIIVKCDVLLLQETWLAKQELELINDIHEEYSGFGTAKCDYANGIITGRKSGGTAILWKTNICGIDLKYDWCRGIRIQSGDSATVVINVYLPYMNVQITRTLILVILPLLSISLMKLTVQVCW